MLPTRCAYRTHVRDTRLLVHALMSRRHHTCHLRRLLQQASVVFNCHPRPRQRISGALSKCTSLIVFAVCAGDYVSMTRPCSNLPTDSCLWRMQTGRAAACSASYTNLLLQEQSVPAIKRAWRCLCFCLISQPDHISILAQEPAPASPACSACSAQLCRRFSNGHSGDMSSHCC